MASTELVRAEDASASPLGRRSQRTLWGGFSEVHDGRMEQTKFIVNPDVIRRFSSAPESALELSSTHLCPMRVSWPCAVSIAKDAEACASLLLRSAEPAPGVRPSVLLASGLDSNIHLSEDRMFRVNAPKQTPTAANGV